MKFFFTALLIFGLAAAGSASITDILSNLKNQLNADLQNVKQQAKVGFKQFADDLQEGLKKSLKNPAQGVRFLVQSLLKDYQQTLQLAQSDYQIISEQIQDTINVSIFIINYIFVYILTIICE